MRDPERINRILNLIDHIWNKYPDLRLCQLISNTIKVGGQYTVRDIFYVEDDWLEDKLKKDLETITEYHNSICWLCDKIGVVYRDAVKSYWCDKCFDEVYLGEGNEDE
jgi:uncharacterized protein YihD (DUF1040 family)